MGTSYQVRCTVCERISESGASPLKNGWPKCCGYTMRLEDTARFIADVDEQVTECITVKERD
jgi:hypothetical protein